MDNRKNRDNIDNSNYKALVSYQTSSELNLLKVEYVNINALNQNDILIQHKMPLIKPTLHPLDRPSKWNNPKKESEFTLSSTYYISSHY